MSAHDQIQPDPTVAELAEKLAAIGAWLEKFYRLVNDRMASMADDVETLAKRSAGDDSGTAEVTRVVDAVSDLVARIESRVAELKTADTASIAGHFEHLETRIDAIRGAVTGLSSPALDPSDLERLRDDLTSQVSEMASAMADLVGAQQTAISAEFARILQARLDSMPSARPAEIAAEVEVRLAPQFSAIDAIRSGVTELLERAADASGTSNDDAIALELTRIAESVESNTKMRSAVEDVAVAVGDAITGIHDRIGQLEGVQERLTAAVSAGDDTTEIVEHIADLRGRLDEVATGFARSLGNLAKEVSAGSKTDQVEQVLSRTRGLASAVEDLVSSVGDALAGIHERLDFALAERDDAVEAARGVGDRLDERTSEVKRAIDELTVAVGEGISALQDRLAVLVEPQGVAELAETIGDAIAGLQVRLDDIAEYRAGPDDSTVSDLRAALVDLQAKTAAPTVEVLDALAAIQSRVESLAAADDLRQLADDLRERLDHRVDVLDKATFLDAQARNSDKVIEFVAKTAAPTVEVLDALAAIQSRVESLAAADDLRQLADDLRERLDHRVDVLDKATFLDAQARNSDKVIEFVAEVAGALSEAVSAIESRLGPLSSTEDRDASELANRIDELIVAVGELVPGIEGRIDALGASVRSRLDALADELSQGADANESSDRSAVIRVVEGHLQTVALSISTIAGRLDRIAAEPAQQALPAEEVEALRSTLSKIESEVSAVTANTEGLRGLPASVSGLHEQFESLRGARPDDDPPAWVSDLSSTMERLMSRLDATEASVTAQADQVQAAVSELLRTRENDTDRVLASLYSVRDEALSQVGSARDETREWFTAVSGVLDALSSAAPKGPVSVDLTAVLDRLDDIANRPAPYRLDDESLTVLHDTKSLVEHTSAQVASVLARVNEQDLAAAQEYLANRLAAAEAHLSERHETTLTELRKVEEAVAGARAEVGLVLDGQRSAASTAGLLDESLNAVARLGSDIQRAVLNLHDEWAAANGALSSQVGAVMSTAEAGIGRTDEVVSRVDDLNRTTQTRLDAWQRGIEALEARLSEIINSMIGPEEVKAHLDEQRVALGGVAAELRAVRAQFQPEALTAEFAGEVQRILAVAAEGIDAAMETLDARKGDVAALVERVEDRLTAMENRVSAVVAEVTNAVATWGETVSTEVRSHVEALNLVAQQSSEIRAVRSQIDDALDHVQVIAAAVNDLADKEDAEAMRSEVASVARTVAGLSRSVGALDQTLVGVRTEIAAGGVLPDEAAVSATDKKVAELTRIVNDGLAAVQDRLRGLSEAIGADAGVMDLGDGHDDNVTDLQSASAAGSGRGVRSLRRRHQLRAR